MRPISGRLGLPLLLALATAACAAGNSTPPPLTEGGVNHDGRRADAGPDGYVWPDMGHLPDAYIYPDGVKYDFNANVDGPGVDAPSPPDAGGDTAPPPDAKVPCPDPLEPNQTCSSGKSLGTAKEGSTWYKKNATLDPGSDIDWYKAKGEEDSHTCFPLTSQCYYFSVKLDVPLGRKMRVCVYKESCTASGSCASNATTPGPTTLNVKYKVSGTCALNDDTDAYIKVEQLDGTGGCGPYTVSFNYDEC